MAPVCSKGGPGGAGMGKIMGIGKANAVGKEATSKVTFKDVAGCDEAKVRLCTPGGLIQSVSLTICCLLNAQAEIMEFVDFLKDPTRFTKLGARIPKVCACLQT